MAKGVFQILGSGVGHMGKRAEGGHIDEGLPIEFSNVNVKGLAFAGGDGSGFDRGAGEI